MVLMIVIFRCVERVLIIDINYGVTHRGGTIHSKFFTTDE